MKTTFLYIVLAVFLVSNSSDLFSQEKCDRHEKIKAKKVAYLTEKLDLTVAEAQQFWPLYNEFEKKQDEIVSKKRKLHKSFANKGESELTEADYEKMADTYVESHMLEAKLIEEYHEKYKEILSSKKIVTLIKAERDFHRELIKEVRNHHGEGKGHGRQPE